MLIKLSNSLFPARISETFGSLLMNPYNRFIEEVQLKRTIRLRIGHPWRFRVDQT